MVALRKSYKLGFLQFYHGDRRYSPKNWGSLAGVSRKLLYNKSSSNLLLKTMEKLQTPVEFTLDVANIPEDVRREAELKAREVYVMTLLERGIISSGRAARILGISRLEAIALMDRYGISVFAPQTREELEREVAETIAMLEEYKK